jgi:hypothetical protein
MKNEIPLKAIRELVSYLEHDERKDYENYLDDDGKVIAATKEEAESHIYNHVQNVSDWLENLGTDDDP